MRNNYVLPWVGIDEARSMFENRLGDKNFDECFKHLIYYPPCKAKNNVGFLMIDDIAAEIKTWPHTPYKEE